MTNCCLFCDANGAGVLSKEHVIPKWLIEHLDLPDDDLLFQGVADSKTDALRQPPRIHSTFNFVQGHVCRKCNNGWMCRLEAISKPILLPLIEEQRSLKDLSTSDAMIVGKWAVKSAYLHSITSPLNQPVEEDHFKALTGDAGVPFPGVSIFGMQADFKEQASYFLTRYWNYSSNVEVSVDIAQTSYKIGLQFRNLYLLVAFWPDPMSHFLLATDMHTLIFPRHKRLLSEHSGAFTIGEGAVDRLAVFSKSLGLWIGDPLPTFS